MNTRTTPRQLAFDLCARSPCRTKMAAVLYDNWGIFSWGWNHSGPNGLGQHAEDHCLRRANKRRLRGSGLVVVGFKPSGNTLVTSKPCSACWDLIRALGVGRVTWWDQDVWRQEEVR
jgi:tRNA(Arg) A34 adenosine deaminase TadA